MTYRLPVLFLAAALSCSLATSCSQQGDASSDAKSAVEPPVLVRLGKLERGDVSDRLAVAADLEAIARADVPPEIAGMVAEVLKREGDAVRKGEPVIRLDDAALTLAVEQKRILAAQARQKVEQSTLAGREGKTLAEQKRILLEKAKAEYERIKDLADEAKSGVISKEDADIKRYAHEQARLDLDAALIQADKYTLEHSQAVESQKLADVELRTAEHNLSRTTIRSPIDGEITYLIVKPGESLTVGTKAFSVVDTSRLEARLHVPQRELARIRIGLPVRIHCEVFPDRTFEGSIEVVNPVVDKVKGTVQLIVGVTDKEKFLKPGMFINGEVILDTRRDVYLVTKKAVSYENQEPILFLVKDGVAHRYALKPGYSTKTHIEVLGLTGVDGSSASPADGDLVEVGHNNLKEGSRVEIEASGPPGSVGAQAAQARRAEEGAAGQ